MARCRKGGLKVVEHPEALGLEQRCVKPGHWRIEGYTVWRWEQWRDGVQGAGESTGLGSFGCLIPRYA